MATKVKQTKVDSAEWWAQSRISRTLSRPWPAVRSTVVKRHGGSAQCSSGLLMLRRGKSPVRCSTVSRCRPPKGCGSLPQTGSGSEWPSTGQVLGMPTTRSRIFWRGRPCSIRPTFWAFPRVLRGTLVKGCATLEVRRDGEQRTLIATNDKGETAERLRAARNLPQLAAVDPDRARGKSFH